MNPKMPVTVGSRLPSGIDSVDSRWGGLYKGGTYVVYGRSSAGRGLFAMIVAARGCQNDESIVVVSPSRSKDLVIEASTIGFDLRDANRRGSLRIMRTPPLLGYQQPDDENVGRALRELSALITSHDWDRVVVTDFMPFARFNSFDAFQLAFLEFLEETGNSDAVLLLGMPEPANDQSLAVIDFMTGRATAAIHVSSNGSSDNKRTLALIPHYGHVTRESEVEWDLQKSVDAADSLLRREARVTESSSPVQEISEQAVPEPQARLEDLLITETTFPGPAESSASPTAAPSTKTWRQNGRFISRRDFSDLLRGRFSQRSDSGDNFLLIALRMDRGQNGTRRAYDFDFVVNLVRDSLRNLDRALVDEHSERIVICLSPGDGDESHRFFARLKERLRQRLPEHADEFLHAVSAIVVPDGRPFGDEEEFLNFVFS